MGKADLDFTVMLGGGLQVGSGLGGVRQLITPHGPADAPKLVEHLSQLAVGDQHGLALGAAQGGLQLLLCQLQDMTQAHHPQPLWCTLTLLFREGQRAQPEHGVAEGVQCWLKPKAQQSC